MAVTGIEENMQDKRVMLTKFACPEELRVETVDGLPEPAAGEIRVRVLMARTVFTDTIIWQGQYVGVLVAFGAL
jgi:NADPH:quinone reductase-like Zn-dependent oxidoreductase